MIPITLYANIKILDLYLGEIRFLSFKRNVIVYYKLFYVVILQP